MTNKIINSVEDFFLRVKSDYESWNTNTYPWFRGEPDKPDTALLPKLYRKRNPDGTFFMMKINSFNSLE